MEIDLTPIIENDKEFEIIAKKVLKEYSGIWNDPVHNSYHGYVRTMEYLSQRVHTVKCRAEAMEKEIEELKIDEMLQKAQHLCEEAEAI